MTYIAIAGASGLVGRALVPFLVDKGHQVLCLTRNRDDTSGDALFWNPYAGELDPVRLEGIGTVVNLSGENIGASRWSLRQKEKILQSRLMATKTICEAISRMATPPQLLLNASAVGYYGDTGDDFVTEAHSKGNDFLADVCAQWEAATQPLSNRGVRVLYLRFGTILTPSGGALRQMLTPFKLGIGGALGNGKQYLSWIALDDVLGAILHLMTTPYLKGPFNLVAPNPVTNQLFTQILASTLHRPHFFTLPAPLLRLFFGEIADALLLKSCRAVPKNLLGSGYDFLYPDVQSALSHLLSRQ